MELTAQPSAFWYIATTRRGFRLLLKAEDAAPKVYSDERGSFRWITVHPNGDDAPGVPVKIRESRNQPGTWHVVGGADGKLNYMTLHNLGTPKEWAEKAKARREKKQSENKRQLALQAAKPEDLSDAAKQEVEQRKANTEKLDTLRKEMDEQRQERMSRIAEAAGWEPDQWQFGDRRKALEADGVAKKRIDQLEAEFNKKVERAARDVLKATRNQLLLDAEMRAHGGVGELPPDGKVDEAVTFSDLLPPEQVSTGLGYRRELMKLSDAEITSELAAVDVQRLEAELAAKNEAIGEADPEHPDAREQRGERERIAAELEAAKALAETAKYADKPEELERRKAELEEQRTAAVAEREEIMPELMRLRAADQEKKLPPAQREVLMAMEQAVVGTREREENIARQLTWVAAAEGHQAGVVEGHKRELAAKRRADVERRVLEEHGPKGLQAWVNLRDGWELGLERYRAEMKVLRKSAAAQPPTLSTKPIVDPRKAVSLLTAEKRLAKAQRELSRSEGAGEGADKVEALFGQGFWVPEESTADLTPEVKRDIDNELTTIRTQAFLHEVETLEKDPTLADLEPTDRRLALRQHVGAGAYKAMNNAALVIQGQGVLKRDVCDVLGHVGAAQVLAKAIAASHSAEDLAAIRTALEKYHVDTLMRSSNEAMTEAGALYDEAKAIELHQASDIHELAEMQAVNRQRVEMLEQARQILGETLGEMEATAALVYALRNPKAPIKAINLGTIGPESAIRSIRALGLGRDDFDIDFDGTNRFLTLRGDAHEKLVEPVDEGERRMAVEVERIKRGEKDEAGWLPDGFISRPASTFHTNGLVAPASLGKERQATRPANQWGTGGVPVTQDVEDFIGAFASDGAHAADVYRELQKEIAGLPDAGHRREALAHLDTLMPLEQPVFENGKPVYETEMEQVPADDGHGTVLRDTGRVKVGPDGQPVQKIHRPTAEFYEPVMRRLAEQYAQRRGGDVSTIHGQGLRLDGEGAKATHEALFRALAVDPRRMVAWKDHADMASDDKAALRHYFNSELARPDRGGVDVSDLQKAIDDLGPEPPKQSDAQGELGRGTDWEKQVGAAAITNPEWVEWKRKRDDLVAERHDRTKLEWDSYVRTMGGAQRAYQAVQDKLKHDYLTDFARIYGHLHGEQHLRVGETSIRNGVLHTVGVGGREMREAFDRERDQLQGAVQKRNRGKFAVGGVLEAMKRAKERIEREDQSQVELNLGNEDQGGLFGGGGEQGGLFGGASEPEEQGGLFARPDKAAAPPTPPTAPHSTAHQLDAGDRRVTIGQRAEGQIASLMPNIASNFRGHLTEGPVGLFPGLSMSGKTRIKGVEVDVTAQQRAIKMFLARKRMGAFLGVGSGKTAIQLGGFLAARKADPTVKRGLFIVPSKVQGQFHGEAASMIDPAAGVRWHAKPGASSEERAGALSDPNMHMVVVTHQGLRDDLMKLLATRHAGQAGDRGNLRQWFEGLSRKERAAEMAAAMKGAGWDFQASFVDEGHVLLDRDGKPDSLLSAAVAALSDNTPYYMTATADPAKNDLSEIRSQLSKMAPGGRYDNPAEFNRRYGVSTSSSRDALRREASPYFFIDHIQPPTQRRQQEVEVKLSDEQHGSIKRTLELYDQIRANRAKGGEPDIALAKELAPAKFEGVPEDRHADIAKAVQANPGPARDAAIRRLINTAPAEQNAKVQRIVADLAADPPSGKPTVIFAHNLKAVDTLHHALEAAGHRVVSIHGGTPPKESERRLRAFQKDSTADVLVLSDCGATGLNLQRGKRLYQFDTPQTAMGHEQRAGRIYRLGQQDDVDTIDLVTDTAIERADRKRYREKSDVRSMWLRDATEAFDDTDLGAYMAREYSARDAAEESRVAQVAA